MFTVHFLHHSVGLFFMQAPRVYQNQTLIEGSSITLDDNGSRHLGKVLRKSTGDPVIIFNGTGGEYHGAIQEINNKNVCVSLDFFNEADRSAPLRIHLGQVMGKGNHMDFALQKAVELGISEITPLLSAHCEVRLKGQRLEKKMDQWRHLIISACEQCGLNILPILHPPVSLVQWTESTDSDIKWILHTDDLPSDPFIDNGGIAKPASISFAVGPEGGFSDDEIEQARTAGFQTITLGPRIWRTETAPIVMLSLIQMKWGDFL